MKKNDISAFNTTNEKQLDKASSGGVTPVNSKKNKLKKKAGRPARSKTGEKASKKILINVTPAEYENIKRKGAPATVVYEFLEKSGFLA